MYMYHITLHYSTEKHLFTFLHFHKIINPDETATDTKSLRNAVFKEKCVPRASGRLTTALNRIRTTERCTGVSDYFSSSAQLTCTVYSDDTWYKRFYPTCSQNLIIQF